MNKIVSYLKKMKQIYVNNRFNKKRLNKTKRIAQKAYKNKEPITIFSTNCIAGEIYNLLGLRFDSPTINCSFNRRDFIKFMENLDFYIKQKPKAIIDKNKVPILLFEKNPNDAGEEIKIFFPHDTNKEIVLENWEKRKKGLIIIEYLLFAMIED